LKEKAKLEARDYENTRFTRFGLTTYVHKGSLSSNIFTIMNCVKIEHQIGCLKGLRLVVVGLTIYMASSWTITLNC